LESGCIERRFWRSTLIHLLVCSLKSARKIALFSASMSRALSCSRTDETAVEACVDCGGGAGDARSGRTSVGMGA